MPDIVSRPQRVKLQFENYQAVYPDLSELNSSNIARHWVHASMS